YFSFHPPGYKFMPAYKRKQWSGKIHLFNSMTGMMNAGLYAKLCKFAADRHYHVKMVPSLYGLPNEKNEINHQQLVKEFAEYGTPFEPRDYQYKAITHAIERKRCLLISPTGSGKSFIIYNIMRWYLNQEERQRVLIVVPTTSLVEQMFKDFKDYGYDSENEVHIIYSGKEKVTDKRVIITTWQSVYKLEHDWFEQFGCVFGDECHLFKAKSLSTLMNKCTEADYRFGTSGTLDGTQVNKLVLEGLFGPTKQVTFTRDLQEDGTLANLHIDMLMLDYPQEYRRLVNGMKYHEEMDFLVGYEPRNKFIRNLALTQKGNTLVLFQYVEKHGEILHNMIKEKSKSSFYVHGGTDVQDRESIRGIVNNSQNAIIVASFGTFSTGINIPNIHNIIFASPSKSQVRVLQSIGRGLRKSTMDTKLIDLIDDLSYEGTKNYSLTHSKERSKIYEREQFDFKIHKVAI
ncbi:MAG: DEAD/DEAH box helicase family protein, partial [Candidatus Poseidoniales archaeon]